MKINSSSSQKQQQCAAVQNKLVQAEVPLTCILKVLVKISAQILTVLTGLATFKSPSKHMMFYEDFK
jgi:hypothetical protein